MVGTGRGSLVGSTMCLKSNFEKNVPGKSFTSGSFLLVYSVLSVPLLNQVYGWYPVFGLQ